MVKYNQEDTTMKLDKAQRRDKKSNKARNGMKISGRSVFTIQEQIVKKGKKGKKGAGP